jgi:nucleotide-binding universal stress UspA family protein
MEDEMAAVMVHVASDEGVKDRIKLAADLARRFDADLIGVAGWPLLKQDVVEHPFNQRRSPQSLRQEEIERRLALLEEQFRQSVDVKLRAVEWRASSHFPNEVIAKEAFAADLIVIGRDALPGDIHHTFDPGNVILATGRPILVLPPGKPHLPASRIVIAWKNTREARRAVFDALPFLKQAQSVSIAAVCPLELEKVMEQEVGRLAHCLTRHGVALGGQIIIISPEAEGSALLKFAEDTSADLLIAGAYGHTRLGEWLFGGVTRHLLTNATVPCLFSN